MEALLKRKKVLKSKVTRLQNILKDFGQYNNSTELEYYAGQISVLWSEVNAMLEQVAVAAESEDNEVETELFECLDKLDGLQISINTAIADLKRGNRDPPERERSRFERNECFVNLPKIELPSFTGDLHQWLPFQDLFKASIHSNSNLSGAQKLQYLKLCLKGEAAGLIQTIPVADDNYERAWDTLVKRYHNEAEIVDAQLDRLCKQHPLLQESANGLRKLIDTTSECVAALKGLSLPVEHWDCILIYLIRQKLDSSTLRQWEISKVRESLKTFAEFVNFLDIRAKALAAIESSDQKTNLRVHRGDVRKGLKSKLATHHVSSQKCRVCGGLHSIYKCGKFMKLSVSDRINLTRRLQLCFNCLRSGHVKDQCESGPCKNCNRLHHSLLHYSNPHIRDIGSSDAEVKGNSTVVSGSSVNEWKKVSDFQVLLPTALIMVYDRHRIARPCRALLDSGSQSNLISEDCAQRLGLRRQRADVTVTGLSGAKIEKARASVCLEINAYQSFPLKMEAVVLPRITCDLPQYPVPKLRVSDFSHMQLADPTFHKPSKIDILLGAEAFSKVVMSEKCELTNACALLTVFGWVVIGKVPTINSTLAKVTVHHSSCEIESALQKFWEIEEIQPSGKLLSCEERKCEDLFKSTFRDHNGRFVVRLPFRDEVPRMDGSRAIAVQRLKQVEKRFTRGSPQSELYGTFMEEYFELNHMSLIATDEAQGKCNEGSYLPHHAVGKELNSSTKFRVVFDASAKTSNGDSLNDKLLVGPTLQDGIIPILLRFRSHKIAMVADIEKMYRQILVHPEDRKFQRIVWRAVPDDPIKDFQLNTVTYGTACAPYLATKCLQILADEGEIDFPKAAEVLRRDFYMDDMMSGAQSVEEAQELQVQLLELLRSAGFKLRKWSSNKPVLLEPLPPDLRETTLPFDINTDSSVKTLGLNWHPAADCFSFRVNVPVRAEVPTKRTILSTVARVFDPLGLLAPVIVKAKIILQKLWKLKLEWDDPLPEILNEEWRKFFDEMSCLVNINVPRCITHGDVCYELHGFCDASEAAYAAVVYLRCFKTDETIKTEILISKTRVAPVRVTSIPRLELCGALLLAKLVELIQDCLMLRIEHVHAWTDSMVVLCWLSSDGQSMEDVGNRVAKIQNIIPSSNWRHVGGENNPADCASRGVFPSRLNHESLWWHGPDFLKSFHPVSDYSVFNYNQEEVQTELRKVDVPTHLSISGDPDFILKFSSLTRLKRVTAYSLRFIFNARATGVPKRYGWLSTLELSEATNCLVKIVQASSFPEEVECLKRNKPLPCKSSLLPLSPFLDSDGVIRVGGRLRNSNLSVDQKHPILLPKSHAFTELVISHYHLANLHAGPQLIQATIQQRFWIISARDSIRRVIRKCVICARHRMTVANQMMGDLPVSRVTPTHAFARCGVDYAGPFQLRLAKGRCRQFVKCYIALFVCFVTRAVHIELVSDLTTDAFIAALKRFISRRGKPSDMYSDCGTNFVGARKRLSEFERMVRSQNSSEILTAFISNEGVAWHFNPPAAPHMGGLWEAGIKSLKFHLKRIVGNIIFTPEEFSTVLTQIEACMNSRPLTPMSSDPNDCIALTPGHFLIGRPLTSFPEPSYEELPPNRLDRWQLSQRIFQHFWKRWHKEYLSRLQQRPKWLSKSANIKIGDLVLLKEDDAPPLKWHLGRVVNTFPGDDGCVRVVNVRNADGKLLKRPICKLSQLPI